MRFKVRVPGVALAVWLIATLCPATVKLPLRFWTPALALTVQGAVLPAIETEAQPTFEPADAGGQSPGSGVIVMLPEAPAGPALMLVLLSP